MPLLPQKNVLFIHIPRTSGTLIEKLLGINFDWQYPDLVRLTGLFQRYPQKFMLQHLTCMEILNNNFINLNSFFEMTKFSVVRNPYYRIASLYEYWGGAEKWGNFYDFLSYIKTMKLNKYNHKNSHNNICYHLLPQYKYLCSNNDEQLLVENICYFEKLIPDLKVLFSRLNIHLHESMINIQKMEKNMDYYKSLYSNFEMKQVQEIYRKDFIIFNYDMLLS